MKYNDRYRKLSTVKQSRQMYEAALFTQSPSEIDPIPSTVEGTHSLVERFYSLNRNTPGPPLKHDLPPLHSARNKKGLACEK